MEEDIEIVKSAIRQALQNNREWVVIGFRHSKYANNLKAQQDFIQTLNLNYFCKWEELYDNHGIAWITQLTIHLR